MNMLPISALTIFSDEPFVMDLDLAKWLGMADPHEVRRLIERNRVELEMHGEVSAWLTETSFRGGRPGKAFYLNEPQALVVCALSRTPRAADARKALINVFQAYRTGKLVQVSEHRRRLPNRKPRDTYEANLRFLRAFADNKEAMLELMAGTLTRLDQLEAG